MQTHSFKQNRAVPAYNIELVDKLVRTLEVLRDAPGGLTLQQLTERTGYIKSSIHRTLGSLKWHGYVEQPVPGGPYRLGIKMSAARPRVERGGRAAAVRAAVPA